MQVEACSREAERLSKLINTRNPTLTSYLILSPLTASTLSTSDRGSAATSPHMTSRMCFAMTMLTFLHWWLSDGDVTRWYTASGTSPAALWSRATRAEWCSAGLGLPCGKGLMCEVLRRFEMAKDSQTSQDFAGDIAETKNREVCPFFASFVSKIPLCFQTVCRCVT